MDCRAALAVTRETSHHSLEILLNATDTSTMDTHQDHRIRQANREALAVLAVYALYFLWWYVSGYGLGNKDPETYSYIFGFPAWFFYSCILGYPLTTVLLWLVVRLFFKEIPLDADVQTPPPIQGEDK